MNADKGGLGGREEDRRKIKRLGRSTCKKKRGVAEIRGPLRAPDPL